MSRNNDIVVDSSIGALKAQGLGLDEARHIHAFARFLAEVGRPDKGNLRRCLGWLPYALGFGPYPDEDYAQVALTAWTLPS